MPLYVLLIEDGNGLSEVAAIGLLANEQQETLSWFFEMFKKHNPASSQTKTFMTDKDMKERSVINLLFPNARLVICLFHTLRTFNREISCEKLGVTPAERDSSKKYCEALCYAKTEVHYQNIYSNFIKECPTQVVNYYTKNWHEIRTQWARGLVYNSGNFCNTTNNRLESFNTKLKSVIPLFSELSEFFKNLFIIIKCLL